MVNHGGFPWLSRVSGSIENIENNRGKIDQISHDRNQLAKDLVIPCQMLLMHSEPWATQRKSLTNIWDIFII